MGYELQDFNKDVLEASNSTPVVIDFWAEWCGPCRQLGPTIEKLAGEAGGRWKLVKIDTDRNPDIAVQFGVRGIPAVKMVYQKEIIAEFTGAQPEHLIRKWLQENLPQNGEDGSDEVMSRVKQLLGEGKRDAARELLSEQVDEQSGEELKVRYAMLLLPDETDSAKEWLDSIENRAKYEIELETVETVERLKHIAEGEAEPEGENPDAVELYVKAATELIERNFEEALQKFIQCLQIERTLDDDGARKACIACFAMFGEQHPLTIRYRRQFSMSLY